ncbi:MAG: aspartate/glutamate racemase family protein [Candidatus Bathyarchaeia archaeon]
MPRLGLIIPSSNTTMEREFNKLLPEGFSVHTARLRLREVTVKELAEMEKEVEDEALKLADAGVNVIGYGCTSGSLFKGLGHDKVIEARIERASGIPAVATAGTVVSALKALNVKRVAVATPYIKEINDLEEDFLSSNGFQVVELKGLGIKDNIEIGRLDSQAAYELVMELRYAEADGVFISCTNFPTLDKIRKLEDTLRKPVISSNTATFWAMLRKCGISIKIKDFGKLLGRI